MKSEFFFLKLRQKASPRFGYSFKAKKSDKYIKIDFSHLRYSLSNDEYCDEILCDVEAFETQKLDIYGNICLCYTIVPHIKCAEKKKIYYTSAENDARSFASFLRFYQTNDSRLSVDSIRTLIFFLSFVI